MKRIKLDWSMFQKGAMRYGTLLFGVLVLLLVVMFAGFGSSAESLTVDDMIASESYVDVGISENQVNEKVSLDLVVNRMDRKCLLVDVWDDTLGSKDVGFYLRDNNFGISGKAEVYSVETKSREVPINQIYEDVAYDCNIIDNQTQEEVSSTCYRPGLKSYDTETVYYDEDVLVGSFDMNSDLAAGDIDFSSARKLKFCFNTPIVNTGNGWGNAGTVFVKIGDSLLVDKQHSSWWDESWSYRKSINVSNLDNELIIFNYTMKISVDTADMISNGKLQADCDDLRVICGSQEMDIVLGNATSGLRNHWASARGCADTNTTLWVQIPFNITASNNTETGCHLYYDNSGASKYNHDYNHSIFLFYDDFDGGKDSTKWDTDPGYGFANGEVCGQASDTYMKANFSGRELYMPYLRVYGQQRMPQAGSTYGGWSITGEAGDGKTMGTARYNWQPNGESTNVEFRRQLGGASVTNKNDTWIPDGTYRNYQVIRNGDGSQVVFEVGTNNRIIWTTNTTSTTDFMFNKFTFVMRSTSNCFNDTIIIRDMDVNPLFSLGAEETNETTPWTEESDARTAIETGITNKIPTATIYTDQQLYVRYLNTTQILGSFDKIAVLGNQRWAFNFNTTNETYTSMFDISPSFYVWENMSLNTNQITDQVEALIDTTLAS